MRAIPFYNMVFVPGVTLYFKGEYFKNITGGEAREHDEFIFLMIKEDKEREDLTADDIYPIGVSAVVESVGRDGDVEVSIINRVTFSNLHEEDGSLLLDAEVRPDILDMSDEEAEKHLNDLKAAFVRFVADNQWGMMARGYVMQWKSIGEIVTIVGSQLPITNEEKYAIMAADRISERNALMEQALYQYLELAKVSNEAESAQVSSNEKLYREDAIKKQMEYLQKELDEMHPENVSDVRRFERLIEESGMNETAKKEAVKVLGRMKHEGQNSSEYGLLYDYLDFVTGLSWKPEEMKEIDIKEAEEILDEDHYGLKKVKDRVLQQIAVMNLNRKQAGSILLFVGAPGTGKTSIGQSIAKALHRKYVRVSLGGVRDEAEIRGHRRTYIGAMPGRIMDGIRKSGVSNPVVVLDEVDKLSRDFSGDPASALLEVLDPEQNSTFTDHYMNVPYDLSGVLFLCTANSVDTIPEPLLNRMEVIEFPGYTAVEKLQIARRHLLPRAMQSTGIKSRNLKVSDEALEAIISDYTMESGVRGLKKCLDTLCRVAAVKLVRGDQKSITVSPKRLEEFLDAKPLHHDKIQESGRSGVVTGLAWTRAGGEILFIEAVFTKGSGKTIITGQLGDVMKESVQIAISLVKMMYPDSAELFAANDLHVHVPEGAVPKDGPSAGITLTSAIASLVTGKIVQPQIAMTGEVSLRGLVMPIGGLPEKLMAAQRAGVKKVFIP
ncbi:MAG: endopeptidase La, partial [Lachnospiraceae bacterium]|nr:endopeptidase La [Lachnospiraceae bacterium]